MAKEYGASSSGIIGCATFLSTVGVIFLLILVATDTYRKYSTLQQHTATPTQTIPADCEQTQILKDDLGGTYAICIQRVADWPRDKLQISVLRPSSDTSSGWKADGFTFYPLPE